MTHTNTRRSSLLSLAIAAPMLLAPSLAFAEWTTGQIDQHIFPGETYTYETDDLELSLVDDMELIFNYGLWNSPDVHMDVSVNGTFVGTVTADAGFISPGPAEESWIVTGLLVDGVNTIDVTAQLVGDGEAVIGFLTITNADAGPTLDISGSCPGVTTLEMSGFTPGGTIAMLKGSGPGSMVFPGGPCVGDTSGLAGLGLVTTFPADGSGNATVTPSLSGGACGSWLQAMDVTTCDLSNVVEIP